MFLDSDFGGSLNPKWTWVGRAHSGPWKRHSRPYPAKAQFCLKLQIFASVPLLLKSWAVLLATGLEQLWSPICRQQLRIPLCGPSLNRLPVKDHRKREKDLVLGLRDG